MRLDAGYFVHGELAASFNLEFRGTFSPDDFEVLGRDQPGTNCYGEPVINVSNTNLVNKRSS